MFSDAYPACPFPKSFTYQIKKLGEADQKCSSLTDSAEDIKMFDSPDRDSEDFERSLKKTMDCIAQVCDTTVPDKTPLKSECPSSSSPEKTDKKAPPTTPPTLQESGIPRPHFMENLPSERSGVGPMSSKKYSTPPHHPYSRHIRRGPEKQIPQYQSEVLPSYTSDLRPQYPDSGSNPNNGCNSDDKSNPDNRYATDTRSTDTRSTDIRSTDSRFNPSATDPRKGPTNPEHFIFPECTSDLQQEFFMFYMQKCLKQQQMEPPPYSSIGAPGMSAPGMQVSTQQREAEKKFVDSTTSPINPRYFENKENTIPSSTISCSTIPSSTIPSSTLPSYNLPPPPEGQKGNGEDSCIFGTDTNNEQELKPQKLHFSFPSSTPPPPPQTPNLTTPIMGPSMDAALGPSPSFYHPPTSAEYRGSNASYSVPHHSVPLHSVPAFSGLPHSGTVFPHVSTSQSAHSQSGHVPLSPHVGVPPLSTPPPKEHDTNERDEHLPRYLKPPNLPPHLFPDTRSFQNPPHHPPRSANLPPQSFYPMGNNHLTRSESDNVRPKSACVRTDFSNFPDKAIPENLAATYMPPPDCYNKPSSEMNKPFNKPFIPTSDFLASSSHKFSFKDTLGKMLSKKRSNCEAINPTGKRTKFTAEQVRILEHFYLSVNKYVTGSNKGTLCQVTGLELNTILMWFQNKRAREKKQKTNN